MRNPACQQVASRQSVSPQGCVQIVIPIEIGRYISLSQELCTLLRGAQVLRLCIDQSSGVPGPELSQIYHLKAVSVMERVMQVLDSPGAYSWRICFPTPG